MSDNVTVYGGVASAESCVYDTARRLILLPNQGVRSPVQVNDAWGSVLHMTMRSPRSLAVSIKARTSDAHVIPSDKAGSVCTRLSRRSLCGGALQN